MFNGCCAITILCVAIGVTACDKKKDSPIAQAAPIGQDGTRKALPGSDADKQAATRIVGLPASSGSLSTAPTSQPAKEITLDLGNTVSMKLTLIPAGKFMMGSPSDDKNYHDDEGPQHEVTISKPFYMGVYTVTQEQWEQVMNTTLAQQRDKAKANKWDIGQGANYPMYYVSWEDALEFCKKLSQVTGKTVQLPTEAQWEYACRAGTKTRFNFGDKDGDLRDYGWYTDNSDAKTHPVGQKKPNDWDLYDMHGNIWQWCSDWYAEDYYAKSKSTDPQGPASGSYRVMRGSAYRNRPSLCRSASRAWWPPANRDGPGFRVVVDLK